MATCIWGVVGVYSQLCTRSLALTPIRGVEPTQRQMHQQQTSAQRDSAWSCMMSLSQSGNAQLPEVLQPGHPWSAPRCSAVPQDQHCRWSGACSCSKCCPTAPCIPAPVALTRLFIYGNCHLAEQLQPGGWAWECMAGMLVTGVAATRVHMGRATH
jgi:hypothetical protein